MIFYKGICRPQGAKTKNGQTKIPSVLSGAEVTEVGEPHASFFGTLFRSEPVFQAEFEVVAEPKALLPGDLRDLVKKYGGYRKAGLAIGASEAFVRQNALKSNKRAFVNTFTT